MKSVRFLRKLSAYLGASLTGNLLGTIRFYALDHGNAFHFLTPFYSLSTLRILSGHLVSTAVLSAIIVLPFWLPVLFADRYVKKSRLVYYVVSAMLIGIALNLLMVAFEYLTWGQPGRDLIVRRDLGDSPYFAASGLIAGFTFWFIAFRPRLNRLSNQTRQMSLTVRSCLGLATLLVSTAVTSTIYQHLYGLQIINDLNDQIPTTRLPLTPWQTWMNQHRRLQSANAFPLNADGRYVVKFRGGDILLPNIQYRPDGRYSQDGTIHFKIDDHKNRMSDVRFYLDIAKTPDILRAILSDVASVTFTFGNNPTSLSRFLGVYSPASLPYFEVDVSVDLNKTAQTWPDADQSILPQVLAMAHGAPSSFDQYGFSKAEIHGFEWRTDKAMLLVAPASEFMDARGVPLYFLCDVNECLLAYNHGNYPSGAGFGSSGFHLSRSVRFSATFCKLDQEGLLKKEFLVIRGIVADMFPS